MSKQAGGMTEHGHTNKENADKMMKSINLSEAQRQRMESALTNPPPRQMLEKAEREGKLIAQTADGKITNNWPYSTITYWWRMRRPASSGLWIRNHHATRTFSTRPWPDCSRSCLR